VATRLSQCKLFGFYLCIVSKLETLDGSGALLADVPDDVRNGIGLVPQMTISNIYDTHLAISFAVSEAIG
jgi:hypothetical protein